jgi:quercetin dioxygenase-like cupin family protein
MPILGPGQWVDPAGGSPYAAGRFRIAAGGRFDRHLHDDDELWLISGGAATILLEGAERVVRAGDIVRIPAGTTHDILAVHPEVAGFFVETGHPASAHGHRHERPEDAAGHEVPGSPDPGAGD